MHKLPLTSLIEKKNFNQYLDGLKSRMETHNIEFEIIYSMKTAKSSMHLCFENTNSICSFTVWVTGECDVEIMSKETEEYSFQETFHFETEEDFLSTYPKWLLKIIND